MKVDDTPRGARRRLYSPIVTHRSRTFLLAASCLLAAARTAPAAPPADKEAQALVQRYCVACHAAPAPDVLPRSAWKPSIEKMAYLFEGKPMPGWGQAPPIVTLGDDWKRILAYFEANAPAALPSPEPWPAPAASARFERHPIGWSQALTEEPGVSNVAVQDLDGDGKPEILAADMRQGAVLETRAGATDAAQIASVPNPSHVTPVDLDGDKRLDLLIADLGQFFPGDHEKGAVGWARGTAAGFAPVVRWDGFPRVADAQAGDFDGDGRLDVAVAAFGWRAKGNVTVMLNRTVDWAKPAWERVVLDARPGAVAVAVTDLNGDKTLDVVAFLAQEHEEVLFYPGDGKGGFGLEKLFKAPHPNWGSTGLTLVDLDRDGDTDILLSNGDMFDDQLLKPYHSIGWLENQGRMKFAFRTLAHLPGVHKAVAADLDGDGDLDVAAAALTAAVAPSVAATLPSLVWLEQVKPGRWEKRTIEVGNPTHATLAAADVDGDGDVDLVTGTLAVAGKAKAWIDVWENRAAKPR
jgi:cytochrome c5